MASAKTLRGWNADLREATDTKRVSIEKFLNALGAKDYSDEETNENYSGRRGRRNDLMCSRGLRQQLPHTLRAAYPKR